MAFQQGALWNLRQWAFPFQGHRYALLSPYQNITSARRMAQKAGGHLVVVTSPEEARFLHSIVPPTSAFWLGLRRTDRGLAWDNGEPLVFASFAQNADTTRASGPFIQLRTAYDKAWHWSAIAADEPDKVRAAVIVEWNKESRPPAGAASSR